MSQERTSFLHLGGDVLDAVIVILRILVETGRSDGVEQLTARFTDSKASRRLLGMACCHIT